MSKPREVCNGRTHGRMIRAQRFGKSRLKTAQRVRKILLACEPLTGRKCCVEYGRKSCGAGRVLRKNVINNFFR